MHVLFLRNYVQLVLQLHAGASNYYLGPLKHTQEVGMVLRAVHSFDKKETQESGLGVLCLCPREDRKHPYVN